MKKILILLAIAIVAVFPKHSRCQDILNDTTNRLLNISVEELKAKYHSPSVVVLIVHDKKIIYSQALGYTDLTSKTPATADSKYPVMSMTKPFTALMLMQLVQRHVVSLSDNVNKYLPEFQQDIDQPAKDVTTLFQLATHTSGLPRNSQADINFTEQIDRWLLAGSADSVIEPAGRTAFLNSLKYLQYEYPKYQFLPYGDRHYSNLGYCILGMALEKAVKMNYASYMVKNILQPLQMTSSGFLTADVNRKMLARGCFYDEKRDTLVQTPFFKPNSAIYAGGLYTTANDLAKFLSFQFETNSISADRVLSAANRAMMVAENISWRPSYPFATHEGSMIGYRSEIVFELDRKIGWVVLTNNSDINFSRLNNDIAKLILHLYERKYPTGLDQYIGTYQLAGSAGAIQIYLKDGALHSTYLKGVIPDVALTPAGADRFKGAGKGAYNIAYEFTRKDNGAIKAVNMGQFMWVKQLQVTKK